MTITPHAPLTTPLDPFEDVLGLCLHFTPDDTDLRPDGQRRVLAFMLVAKTQPELSWREKIEAASHLETFFRSGQTPPKP